MEKIDRQGLNESLLRHAFERLVRLEDQEWEDFLDHVLFQSYDKGEYLLRNNEVCRSIYLIESGHARSYYLGPEGEEFSFYFGFEGDFIVDYRSFLRQKASTTLIQALSPLNVMALPYDVVHKGYDESKTWERFGRLIAEEIYCQVTERLQDMLQKSPEQRYLEMMEDYPKIFEHVPQYQIASYLGIKPPSLSRIRKRLAAT